MCCNYINLCFLQLQKNSTPSKPDYCSFADYVKEKCKLLPIKERKIATCKPKVNLSRVLEKESRPEAGSCKVNPITPENYPVKPAKWWVKELDLNLEDHSFLTNPQGWLTDKHILAVNKLLHIQFPSQNGLQSPLILAKQLKSNGSNENFVQIVNIANQHWVCISNRLSKDNKVEVYDSLPYYTLSSLTLRKQVAAVIRTSAEFITLEHIQVQHQIGGSDDHTVLWQ